MKKDYGSLEERKIFLLGIDGATWEIIDPLIKLGKLPNFERLIKRGCRASLKSMEPLLTPIIWTTIASGKIPSKHGVTGFFNTSYDIKCKRIWEIFENEKKAKVGIFLWPISAPVPSHINGFIVSTESVRGNIANPSSFCFVKRMLHGKIMNPKTKSEHYRKVISQVVSSIRGVFFGLKLKTSLSFIRYLIWKNLSLYKGNYEGRYIRTLLKRKIFKEVFIHLFKRFQPHFNACYIAETDHFGHHFWKNFEKYIESQGHESELNKYDMAISHIYKEVDRELGEILKESDDNTTFVIVSDHGMRGIKEEEIDIKSNLILEMLEIKENVEVWKQPSTLYLWPKRKSLLSTDELISIFKEIKIAETDEQVFFVNKNDANGLTCLRNTSHTYKDYKDKTVIFGDSSRRCKYRELFQPYDRSSISGMHDIKGIFLMVGPHIREGVNLDDMNSEITVLDIVPTILYYSGLAVAKDMDGRVAKEVFKEEFLENNPVTFIESYEDKSNKKDESFVSIEVSEELKDQLKALGYMD